MNNIVKVKRYNNHPSGIEAKEIIRLLPFQLANVYKYVIRRNDKGTHKEDLEKALEYLKWEKEKPSTRNMRSIDIEFDKLELVIDAEPSEIVNYFLNNFYAYLYTSDAGYLDDMERAIKELIESGD